MKGPLLRFWPQVSWLQSWGSLMALSCLAEAPGQQQPRGAAGKSIPLLERLLKLSITPPALRAYPLLTRRDPSSRLGHQRSISEHAY